MNKHEAAIALALVKANHPFLATLAFVVGKLPWRSFAGLCSVTALGASFRWHDVGRLWDVLT